MKYHALLKTSETDELYEMDHDSLDEIKETMVAPYLKNQEFQFDGYFIDPSKVKRLLISQTDLASDQCVDDAYSKLSPGIIMIIRGKDCVFGDDRYSVDITKNVLQEVKTQLQEDQSEAKRPLAHNAVKKASPKETIFLGYNYREADDEFISGFKDLLTDKGFEVIDGKADGLGSISQAILEKISLSDIVVIVMTKRDKKENGKFTTAAWLLEEKGAALALKKQVGMFVEEEIDDVDIGGMQGDNQRFHFSRNNFLKVAMNFLRIISKQSST
jgi:hypothetical protein